MKKGILLVNLGTPDSPEPKDVRKYLIEFLLDGRVIDIPTVKRNLLVRGIIVPFRYKESARSYQAIWEKRGSPLLYHTVDLGRGLQEHLGKEFQVEIAMRYQSPSIAAALEKMKTLREIIVVPLFPQYASATTGSIAQKVMEIISSWNNIPKLHFIDSFYDHPGFIEAFADRIGAFALGDYDQILFSFHGLPKRQLKKCDPYGGCLQPGCCQNLSEKNAHCYSAQCYATAKALVEKVGISNYSICFQSRLGRDPWIQPYTSDVLHDLAKKGAKKLLVVCPAFVADCIETIHEIGVEYLEEFQKAGGETIDLVPSLNSSLTWIRGLAQIATAHCAPHSEQVPAVPDECKLS